VPVRPDPEQDEIEARRQLDLRRAQRVDLLLGHADTVEERLAREALVRVGMVRRDVALVAPPDVPAGPVEVLTREPLIDGRGRRAAGQGDPERTRTGTRRNPRRRVLG
jgi:hypothetical protein